MGRVELLRKAAGWIKQAENALSGDSQDLNNTVYGDKTPEAPTYSVPQNPGVGAYLGNVGGNTLDYMIFRDAADRARGLGGEGWGLLPKADVSKLPRLPGWSTGLHGVFGGLEGAGAIIHGTQAADPERDWQDRLAAGIQSGLNVNNALAFGGQAVAPWIARKGLGDIFLRTVSGASKMTPSTFAVDVLLEMGRQEADRLNKGTKRSEKWDKETGNIPAQWISMMQKQPDEEYELESVADQNPELYREVLRVARETTKPWSESVREAKEVQSFDPNSKYPVRPITGWNVLNPYAWYARHLRNRENAYNYRQNKITGSIDPNAEDQQWRNGEVVYMNKNFEPDSISAGAIANSAVQDIRRREDPTFVTTDSGIVRSHRAGGMQEPEDTQFQQKPEPPEREYVQPFPIPF